MLSVNSQSTAACCAMAIDQYHNTWRLFLVFTWSIVLQVKGGEYWDFDVDQNVWNNVFAFFPTRYEHVPLVYASTFVYLCALSHVAHRHLCRARVYGARQHARGTWCHIERESRYRYAMSATLRTGTHAYGYACARKLRGPAKRWPYARARVRVHIRVWHCRARVCMYDTFIDLFCCDSHSA